MPPSPWGVRSYSAQTTPPPQKKRLKRGGKNKRGQKCWGKCAGEAFRIRAIAFQRQFWIANVTLHLNIAMLARLNCKKKFKKKLFCSLDRVFNARGLPHVGAWARVPVLEGWCPLQAMYSSFMASNRGTDPASSQGSVWESLPSHLYVEEIEAEMRCLNNWPCFPGYWNFSVTIVKSCL